MNTAIGHLENIMEQQHKQGTTKTLSYAHDISKGRNGVDLDVVVVECLQFSSKTQKKRMNTYRASAVRTTEEEEEKAEVKITQRPKCISRTFEAKEQ